MREPFLTQLLNGDNLAVPKQTVLNVCLLHAINNMLGCVFFETVYDYVLFEGRHRKVNPDICLLEFVVREGVKMRPGQVYFYLFDDE